jgi:hypothetical protein
MNDAEVFYESVARISPPPAGTGDGTPLSYLVGLHYEVLRDTERTALDRLSSLTSLRANLVDADRPLAWEALAKGASIDEVALRLGMSVEDARGRFQPHLAIG